MSFRNNSYLTKLVGLVQLIGKPSLYLITLLLFGLSKIIKYAQSYTLKRSKKKRKLKKKPRHFIDKTKIFAVLIIIFCTAFYFIILKDLPSVKLLTNSPPSLSTKIFDRNGILLYQIYKDENRSLIKLADLPKHVISATIAAEDKSFYIHHGVDPRGILRAAFNNLVNCKLKTDSCTIQGGSTITQQLVKNTLLSPEKTLTRKIKELVLSIETEFMYSKDQILEMYLNQVSYGGTAYGIEEASRGYFGKSARDLTLSEASMLAGLPISPTILSPFGSSSYLGKVRQEQVLESMVQTSAISESDKTSALSSPLIFNLKDTSIRAPHFVMYVKDLLVKQFGEDMVARGGLFVTTTLDITKQDLLQEEINVELANLVKLHVQNGAGLIVAPKTGDILAMVGSKDFFDQDHDGQVNITTQHRQPGSSIKPITYALALSQGMTPYSTIDDSPICFTIKGQPSYCPKNYDGRFHGKVSLRTALASSFNIPAVKLLNTYGLSKMIQLAKNMGITTWEDSSRYGLSLTLGGGEITMLDLASVYSVFANGGTKIPLNSILSIRNSKGSELKEKSGIIGTTVIDPSVAYQINSILSDPFARSPAFGTRSILTLPGPNIAVKTGTTNNLRDNWTFGYTKDVLVATWVGNNDNTPMSSVASGITGASPIWARTMKKLTVDSPPSPFTPPDNMIKINLSCTSSPRYEYFIPGNVARKNCSATPSGTLLNSLISTSQ